MDGPLTHWGQLVCGPPGSGKTTYCGALYEMLNAAGRPTVVVNLDPANERTPYPCAINLMELISVEDAAEAYGLGPNGGLMFCLEFLEANMDWLESKLAKYRGFYFLFDCPGQAELFTHHTSFAKIVRHLQQKHDMRLASVHLVDAHHCSDPTKFIAAALLSLTAMIRLELPHVNVLSKLDLVRVYGEPAFGLDFYSEVTDLRRLVQTIRDESFVGRILRRHGGGKSILVAPSGKGGGASGAASDDDGEAAETRDEGSPREPPGPATSAHSDAGAAGAGGAAADTWRRTAALRRAAFMRKYRNLNERLAEVVEDYAMVSFLPMTIREPDSLLRLIKVVDKAHGFVPLDAATRATVRAVAAEMEAAAEGDRHRDASAAVESENTTAASADSSSTDRVFSEGSGRDSDAIVGAPFEERDFERLSGFEEKYMQRIGADASGSDSDTS